LLEVDGIVVEVDDGALVVLFEDVLWVLENVLVERGWLGTNTESASRVPLPDRPIRCQNDCRDPG